MVKLFKVQLLFIGLLLPGFVFAQGNNFCGTDEAQNLVFKQHPELLTEYLAREDEAFKWDKKEAANNYAAARTSNVIYIVPVVFHIIHQNGPENISASKVRQAIKVMNEDFRKLNADTVTTIPLYKPLMADCEIEFRLATIDPAGNCTNGIERYDSWETNNGGESAKFNQWPQNKYLNIWVVKKMSAAHLNAAAYSYLPGGAPGGGDGIICLYNYVGTNSGNSHTLSHEVGHWLNLKHPWGSNNQPNVACGDDNVTDTPLTKGSNLVCNINLAVCNSPIIENVQNFMDYSFCTTMFTLGQKTRMRAAITSNVAGRSNLWTAANLVATGTATAPVLCAADFITNNLKNIVCENGFVSFTDVSYNAPATSRTWSFTGASLNPPSLITDSIITLKYATAGSFDVGLSVSNASTSVNTVKSQLITVLPSIAAYNTTSYSESFENSALPNADWEVYSSDNGATTWQQFTAAGASGTASVFIENYIADSADVDELISPTINCKAIGSTYLKFKYAFRRKTSADADALKIFTSVDCGKNWTLRKTIPAANLATVATFSNQYFIPTATQWRQDSMSVASLLTSTNCRFKFQFTCGEGNNFYLDDINLIGITGIQEDNPSLDNISIYPNPAKENAFLSLFLARKSSVNLELVNLLGKTMETIVPENNLLEAGNHRFELNSDHRLSSGVYFVHIKIEDQIIVRKLVVN